MVSGEVAIAHRCERFMRLLYEGRYAQWMRRFNIMLPEPEFTSRKAEVFVSSGLYPNRAEIKPLHST